MKRTVTILGILGAMLLLTCAAVAQAKAGGTEQALKDMENKWAAASIKSDTATVSDMLSDDWTGLNPEGKIQTRGDMLAEMKKTKVTRSAVSDMRVRMLGADAAVVTGTWTGAGTDPSGKKFDSTQRWTDVFVKKGGKWKCVASQIGDVKK